MHVQAERPRPVVVMPNAPAGRCLRCDARRQSVCNVIDEADLARLASVAAPMQVGPRRDLHRRG